jgi:hypothetical protein
MALVSYWLDNFHIRSNFSSKITNVCFFIRIVIGKHLAATTVKGTWQWDGVFRFFSWWQLCSSLQANRQLMAVVQLFASQQTADGSCAALCKPTDSWWQLCSSLQANRQLMAVVQLSASQQTADGSCAALCKPTDSWWQLCSSLQADKQLMAVVQLFTSQQPADGSCAALCKPTDSWWQLCSSLQANRQLMTVVQLFASQQTADDSCATLCKPTDSWWQLCSSLQTNRQLMTVVQLPNISLVLTAFFWYAVVYSIHTCIVQYRAPYLHFTSLHCHVRTGTFILLNLATKTEHKFIKNFINLSQLHLHKTKSTFIMQLKQCMKNQKQSENNDETSSDTILVLKVRYVKRHMR